MIKNFREWTEEELKNLINEPENMRLEYKSSAIFMKSFDELRKLISKSVSAFANTEGGLLIIGIKETQGKKKIAIGLDEGVDSTDFTPHRVQQIVESNISPHLTGIGVKPIRLSGKEGRVAYLINVPPGSTAYQATPDKRYYSRSEYEVHPMSDHDIRLRMMKGRVPQAKIEIASKQLVSAEEEFNKRNDELNRRKNIGDFIKNIEFYKQPKRNYDEVIFELKFINTGGFTIKDFLLKLDIETDLDVNSPDIIAKYGSPSFSSPIFYRFAKSKRIQKSDRYDVIPEEEKIFPREELVFPEEKFRFNIPNDKAKTELKCLLFWTIFLDDAFPISGIINLLLD